jgi:SAM-dependent methyltransferase
LSRGSPRHDGSGASSGMRRDWDVRASRNAFHYIDSNRPQWTNRDFYERGRRLVGPIVDPALKLLDVDPAGKRVLEIGCGVGRLFEGLAARFQDVWGIDVSPKMVEQGQLKCATPATWLVGDGLTLAGVPDNSIDHVISYEVFQHIPDRDVIKSYLTEIHRVLRPLATFQVQLRKGSDSLPQAAIRALPNVARHVAGVALRTLSVFKVDGDINTWLGCIISPARAIDLASRLAFTDVATLPDELHRHQRDMGYWLVGRKPA